MDPFYTGANTKIPASAQYAALGHLHRPQDVMSAPVPTRYCGSPLQLDFGEEQQRKSITVVEALAGQPARLNVIPLVAGRSLRTVEGTIDELKMRATEFGSDFLRVYVNLGQPVTGLADQIREFLPNAVQIRPRLQRSEQPEAAPAGKLMLPEEQFGE